MRRRIIPRKDWTDTQSPFRRITWAVRYLYFHHVVMRMPNGARASRATERAYWRTVRQIGINRGFGDISYSYGACPSGRVYELTGRRVGAHTCNYNSNSLALVFAGNFDQEPAYPKMIKSARWWVHRMERRGFIHLTNRQDQLRGHFQVGVCGGGGTACPGSSVRARMGALRRPWRKKKHHHHPHGKHPHRQGKHHHHRHARKVRPHKTHKRSVHGHHHRHSHPKLEGRH